MRSLVRRFARPLRLLGWLPIASLSLGLVGVVPIVRQPTQAAPLPGSILLNGDFEQPNGIEGFAIFRGTSLPYWVVDAGSVELDGVGWQKASGDQSLDLNGEEPGTIHQDVATTPGRRYLLRYAMSGHPFCGPLVMSMEVRWNGSVVATPSFDRTSFTPEDMGWRYDEYLLKATSSSSRVSFASLTAESCGPLLDDISLIPDPSTAVPTATASSTSTPTAIPTCPPTPGAAVSTPTPLPEATALTARNRLPVVGNDACFSWQGVGKVPGSHSVQRFNAGEPAQPFAA